MLGSCTYSWRTGLLDTLAHLFGDSQAWFGGSTRSRKYFFGPVDNVQTIADTQLLKLWPLGKGAEATRMPLPQLSNFGCGKSA